MNKQASLVVPNIWDVLLGSSGTVTFAQKIPEDLGENIAKLEFAVEYFFESMLNSSFAQNKSLKT